MAQWDVFANPSPRMRQVLPYVVVLQSDLLSGLGTRLVAPLARQLPTQPGITARLSPALDVCGERVTLVAQECAPVDARTLREPVASLRGQSHLIIDAFDAVVSGV